MRYREIAFEYRIWVAGAFTALAAFAAQALEGRVPDLVLPAVFSATLAIYNLDGAIDAHARSRGACRRRAHLTLAILGALSVACLALRLPQSAAWLLLGGLTASCTYALPLTRFRRHAVLDGAQSDVTRLKALAGLKAPFIGCAVAIGVVWPGQLALSAVRETGRGDFFAAPLLTLLLALSTTAAALLFDIPDVDEDKRTRTPTAPLVFGIAGTKRLSALLLGISACLALALLAVLSTEAVMGVLALLLALAAATVWVGHKTTRLQVAVVVDGAFFLPLVAMTLSSTWL